jgi:hypothetical protein
LIYDNDPFHFSSKNLIEIGFTKQTDENFRLVTDEFDLKNTLVYYFIKDLGLYSRVDVNTHFFTKREYFSQKYNCTKTDTEGNEADTVFVDNIKTKSPFYPLTLKEGAGINYRILNLSKANLSLRVGFGLQQVYNNDYFVETKPDVDTLGNVIHRYFQEVESETKTGTEVSLVGSFQLPLNLSYSLNADFLFPFNDEKNYTMEWENVFNIKIFKYISLDYKLNLIHKQYPELNQDYIAKDHTLFLRITYFLR